MPKMKSRRAAVKRFRLTGSGKVRRSKSFGSHILTKKSSKRKRKLRKNDLVAKADHKKVKGMI